MDQQNALDAFSALSQVTRLDVFRALVQAGPEGRTPGDLAQALDIRQNTMSANLAVLRHAGLVQTRRDGRSIRYFADFAALRGLLVFLLEDCCGGAPEQCRPLLTELIGKPSLSKPINSPVSGDIEVHNGE